MSEFDRMLGLVQAAKEPRELFGEDTDEARKVYRRLARILHPDTADDKAQATVATALLNALWDRYKDPDTFTITTKRRTYTVESALMKDPISNLYPVSWMDGDEHYGMLRVPRSPKNNDLIANEARALAAFDAYAETLRTSTDPLDHGFAEFRVYAPALIESFRYRDAKTRIDRRANVTGRVDGFVTLTEVHDAYPHGLDGRDAAWIWRRLLAGIGWCHRAGWVNAAILPDQVLVHPTMHGVVFTNWCYGAEIGGRVTAIDPAYRDWYPTEVLGKKPVTTKTDIHLISKLMGWLLGPSAPTQFKAFIKGSTLEFGALPDAWDVQEEFDALLFRLYGHRKYRPLTMPV